MTSICSSPPNTYNHAQVTTSPTLSPAKSISQLKVGITAPSSRRPLYSPEYSSSFYFPRGHDSSDVAAFSKSLEENASMSSHITSRQNKASAPITITSQSSDKEVVDNQPDDCDPQGPFEGPEKLLELWFADSQNDVSGRGLKAVESQVWEEMLDIVKCKILSTIRGSDVDAYLLRCVERDRKIFCVHLAYLPSTPISQRVVHVRLSSQAHSQDVRYHYTASRLGKNFGDCQSSPHRFLLFFVV